MKQRLTLKSLEKASRAVLSNTSFASTPHHVSSIRLVKLQTPPIETQEEKLYRIEREDITKWHHDYWEANNKEFLEAKGHFIRSVESTRNEQPTSDELYSFYKDYLNNTYDRHVQYNKQWWKKTFHMLIPAYKAEWSRLKSKVALSVSKSAAKEQRRPVWESLWDRK